MALPVRPSSTSRRFSPDTHNTTSALDASTSGVAQATFQQTSDQILPTTPMNNANMCGPIIESSPLSSPGSPIPTPPGSWFSKKAPFEKMAPLLPMNASAVDSKASVAPISPGSTKSTASNISKKRSRPDFEKESTPTSEKAPKQRKSAPESKKPVQTAEPTSTRPGRARKAPDRYFDVEQPPKTKPAEPRKAPAGSKTWQPKHVTESYQSRLCKIDVYHMLLEAEPWTCLSLEQKQELFSMLPKTATNKRLLGEIESGKALETTRPVEFGINSNEFRTDVAKFLEELRDGYLGQKWQSVAEQAVIQRAEGAFDDWKDEESEAWWGQK